MARGEPERILRQGVVLPETPRERRERATLDDDLRQIASGGRVRLRLRSFRPSADTYLAASRGPLPYMVRLHEIERRLEALEERLGEEWRGLALAEPDSERFRQAWSAYAASLELDELNDLIERHNRWYPIEARLPMDPATGDFVLVNGRDYRLRPLDASWVFERFPPRRSAALP
ncbi:MAG: hypothetical protein KatS3mg012_1436 [Gaiellaceae bacterium]|nr:MAG: hypothetical protein KatS3mg012_1436 [Gaiellaceae bacterium]